MIENHYEWFDDYSQWNIRNITTLSKLFNTSSLYLEISRCYSLHKLNGKPNWSKNNTLVLNSKEHILQISNAQKLFLFHNYYGVSAKSILINPITVKLINTKEFILQRLVQECNPATNHKRPNYIALDFINENIYRDFIVPFNLKLINFF